MTRQTDITRAVNACRAAGVPIGAVEVTADGTVRVLAPSVALRHLAALREDANTCDEAFRGASST